MVKSFSLHCIYANNDFIPNALNIRYRLDVTIMLKSKQKRPICNTKIYCLPENKIIFDEYMYMYLHALMFTANKSHLLLYQYVRKLLQLFWGSKDLWHVATNQ